MLADDPVTNGFSVFFAAVRSFAMSRIQSAAVAWSPNRHEPKLGRIVLHGMRRFAVWTAGCALGGMVVWVVAYSIIWYGLGFEQPHKYDRYMFSGDDVRRIRSSRFSSLCDRWPKAMERVEPCFAWLKRIDEIVRSEPATEEERRRFSVLIGNFHRPQRGIVGHVYFRPYLETLSAAMTTSRFEEVSGSVAYAPP